MSSKIPVEISFTGVANFLGVLGVIGSLIFVGLELRQTQRIALADMEQRRSEQVTDRSLAFLSGEAEAYANTQGKFLNQLSSKERFLREMHWQWLTQMQQNTLFHYQEGFISESQWEIAAARILQSWNNCPTRELYDEKYLEKAFVAYLATLPDECPE